MWSSINQLRIGIILYQIYIECMENPKSELKMATHLVNGFVSSVHAKQSLLAG